MEKAQRVKDIAFASHVRPHEGGELTQGNIEGSQALEILGYQSFEHRLPISSYLRFMPDAPTPEL